MTELDLALTIDDGDCSIIVEKKNALDERIKLRTFYKSSEIFINLTPGQAGSLINMLRVAIIDYDLTREDIKNGLG